MVIKSEDQKVSQASKRNTVQHHVELSDEEPSAFDGLELLIKLRKRQRPS